jgi:hypothetical protein
MTAMSATLFLKQLQVRSNGRSKYDLVGSKKSLEPVPVSLFEKFDFEIFTNILLLHLIIDQPILRPS